MKKARQEDTSGASMDEIMEAMNFGVRRKSRKVGFFIFIFNHYYSYFTNLIMINGHTIHIIRHANGASCYFLMSRRASYTLLSS